MYLQLAATAPYCNGTLYNICIEVIKWHKTLDATLSTMEETVNILQQGNNDSRTLRFIFKDTVSRVASTGTSAISADLRLVVETNATTRGVAVEVMRENAKVTITITVTNPTTTTITTITTTPTT